MLAFQIENLPDRLFILGSFFNLHGYLDSAHPGAPVVVASLMIFHTVSREGYLYESGRVGLRVSKGFGNLLNKLLRMRLKIVDSCLHGWKLSGNANASRIR